MKTSAVAGFFLAFSVLLTGGCREGVRRIEWPVMGTVAAVQTKDAGAEKTKLIAEKVRKSFAMVEKLLNARDPKSELNRLKTLGDEEILAQCTPQVRPCYEAAFAFRDESGGVFNPRWQGKNTMDLGAIAKGFAVDLAAKEAEKEIDVDTLIDLGGNLKAVRGDWKTRIAGCDETFTLRAGEACATSAEYYRGNHIRNGITGAVAGNAVYSVTAVSSSSAMWADAGSTLAFLLGPEKESEALSKRIDGFIIWIMDDGKRIVSNAGL